MYIYIYIYRNIALLALYISLKLNIYLSLYISLSLCWHFYFPGNVSNFLNKTVEIRLYLSISISLCLSASHCISVVVCASLCLFVCLSVSLCPATIQRTFQKSVNDTGDLSACKWCCLSNNVSAFSCHKDSSTSPAEHSVMGNQLGAGSNQYWSGYGSSWSFRRDPDQAGILTEIWIPVTAQWH